MSIYLILTSFLLALRTGTCNNHRPPNIVFIVADDLGWNDVSWHNPNIKTPFLESIVKSNSSILKNYYVQPLCTPSRSAFLTGYYPYHIGTQHGVFLPTKNDKLDTSLLTLPQMLKQHGGYKTHLIGKWHLGYCNWNMTPTYRGFDSFYGYYNGAEDYYTHRLYCTDHPHNKSCQGLDFRDNEAVVLDKNGTYSTDLFGDKAVEKIFDHPKNEPLFLMVAYQAVHAPVEMPPSKLKSGHMTDRQIFSEMVNAMDKSIERIYKALEKSGLLSNTVLIFTTDNGGQIYFGGNNWPLRGDKNTLWEGGTRGIGFIHSPAFPLHQIYRGIFHAVDWLPTMASIAKINPDITGIDGISQWDSLIGSAAHPRNEFVYNIYLGNHASNGAKNIGLRHGRYKFLDGYPGKPDGWIPPPELANKTIPGYGTAPFLFDIENDPLEKSNLASMYPDMIAFMRAKLSKLLQKYVEPRKIEYVPEANPKYWGDVFTPGWC